MEISDYKLELMALQTRDTELANEQGFKTKQEWYSHIKNQDTDEIASAVIDLSKRYNIPLNVVADNFDPSMVIRVGNIVSKLTHSKKMK